MHGAAPAAAAAATGWSSSSVGRPGSAPTDALASARGAVTGTTGFGAIGAVDEAVGTDGACRTASKDRTWADAGVGAGVTVAAACWWAKRRGVRKPIGPTGSGSVPSTTTCSRPGTENRGCPAVGTGDGAGAGAVRGAASIGETGAGVEATAAVSNGTVCTDGEVGAGGRRSCCGG